MSRQYSMKATRVTWGNITFDSNAEFNCFQTIKKYIPISSIKVHYPVITRPGNEWFPSQEWKVDFLIEPSLDKNEFPIYLEYKGLITDSFKEKVKNLADLRPGIYRNLVIVTHTNVCVVKGLNSVTVPQLAEYLSRKDYISLVENCKIRRKQNV